MVARIKQSDTFKKIFLSFITVFSLFVVVGLSNNVSANTNSNVPSGAGGGSSSWKYYGNGLSCNAYGCKVDWSRAWYCGVNNAAARYATGGKAGIGNC